MINYFKNRSHTEATALYMDICKIDDPKRIREASKQFADLTTPSFRHIILQLSKIKGLQFHTSGNWICVTGESYPHRFQIARINTGEFTRIFHEAKGNWYFKPKDDFEYSRRSILKQVDKIVGVTAEVKGKYNCIWLSGKTYPMLDQIKAINTGMYRRKFSNSRQWYFYPKFR
ncbi:MAG: hypothetical protein RLO17_23800 [Cyclobacteriaceae bacterium]|jgi:hypothetical protein|tara:strand:- start:105078 stop:105596 length:519 start_codon:yes stop_codon:yes gene_type:complete